VARINAEGAVHKCSNCRYYWSKGRNAGYCAERGVDTVEGNDCPRFELGRTDLEYIGNHSVLSRFREIFQKGRKSIDRHYGITISGA